MPGTTVGLSLNFGYAGNVSRQSYSEIEAHPVNASSAAVPFGSAVILNSDNSVSLADATITAANFAGIAVAEVKQMTIYPTTTGSTGGSYAASRPCDVLKRGIATVTLGSRATTPTAGGAVYIRTVLNGTYPSAQIGDFEAASDSTNSVQLTNCVWNTGKVDANNIVELKIKGVNN